MNDTRRNPERSTLDLTCSGPQPQPNHQLPACQPSPGVSNRLCSLLGAPADGRLMAAGSGFLSMRPARRCPHGFPLLMHIGLSKLIGINDENAPLASRLTEAQFRVWGFRWILPCTGFVSTSPINYDRARVVIRPPCVYLHACDECYNHGTQCVQPTNVRNRPWRFYRQPSPTHKSICTHTGA